MGLYGGKKKVFVAAAVAQAFGVPWLLQITQHASYSRTCLEIGNLSWNSFSTLFQFGFCSCGKNINNFFIIINIKKKRRLQISPKIVKFQVQRMDDLAGL